jgi:hypothetical protein
MARKMNGNLLGAYREACADESWSSSAMFLVQVQEVSSESNFSPMLTRAE